MDSEKKFEIELKNLYSNQPEITIGFADMSGHLNPIYNGFTHAVSIMRRLPGTIIDRLAEKGPTPEYFNLYHQVNRELTDAVQSVSGFISSRGFKSLPIDPTKLDTELDESRHDTLRTTFSHKMAAVLSGNGWIGKTDLFISKKFGPRVRLATVLTDYPLKPESPVITQSRCGNCRVCVDACPAQAANGLLWNTSVDRDEFYNAHLCREKCRELSWKNLKEEISICGICVSVCPIGKSL